MDQHEPEWSYEKHLGHDLSSLEEKNLPSCYSNPGSIDAWRHDRMYTTFIPIVSAYKEATWMTVGDGRYRSDAYFLKKNGVDVLATNLSDRVNPNLQNLLCALKLLDYGLACIISFKEAPPHGLRNELRQHGFELILLPKNPYLHDD